MAYQHAPKSQETENLIKALLLNREKQIDWEIISILPDPFNGQDALSLTYRTFRKHTDIPIALPVFSLLAFLSAHLISKNARVRVPNMADPQELDLWVISLADSGSAKTFSKKQIEAMLPEKPNVISEPSGPAGFLDEMQTKNRGLYFQDECAQVLKQIEQPAGPLADLKKYLLQIYDHSTLTRRPKKKEEGFEVVDPCLTIFWLNTIQSFINSISTESLHDGFSQRFLYVIAQKDTERAMEDFPVYSTEAIRKAMGDAVADLFNKPVYDFYDISPEANESYQEGFKLISQLHFNTSIDGSFYRRVMFSAWKYSVLFHLILGKEGNKIDREDMAFALKVCLLHLYSLKNLLKFKAEGYIGETERRQRMVLKLQQLRAECKGPFNARYIMRRTTIKTAKEADYYLGLLEELEKKAA